MKIQEMRNAKQAYEQPWTESIRLQVENTICQASGQKPEDGDDNLGD